MQNEQLNKRSKQARRHQSWDYITVFTENRNTGQLNALPACVQPRVWSHKSIKQIREIRYNAHIKTKIKHNTVRFTESNYIIQNTPTMGMPMRDRGEKQKDPKTQKQNSHKLSMNLEIINIQKLWGIVNRMNWHGSVCL